MSKIDKQSALSQCVCALAEILENLIKIQSDCLATHNSSMTQTQQQGPTMVSEGCSCTGNCTNTERPSNASGGEQKQGDQKQGDQKQGEQKQGEPKQGDQQQQGKQQPQQSLDMETRQNFDFQPDQQQCCLAEPMPSADPEGQWFTMPPARSRTDTRAQFADGTLGTDSSNYSFHDVSSSTRRSSCSTASKSKFQRIVAVRENCDGSISKIYALRKNIKPGTNSRCCSVGTRTDNEGGDTPTNEDWLHQAQKKVCCPPKENSQERLVEERFCPCPAPSASQSRCQSSVRCPTPCPQPCPPRCPPPAPPRCPTPCPPRCPTPAPHRCPTPCPQWSRFPTPPPSMPRCPGPCPGSSMSPKCPVACPPPCPTPCPPRCPAPCPPRCPPACPPRCPSPVPPPVCPLRCPSPAPIVCPPRCPSPVPPPVCRPRCPSPAPPPVCPPRCPSPAPIVCPPRCPSPAPPSCQLRCPPPSPPTCPPRCPTPCPSPCPTPCPTPCSSLCPSPCPSVSSPRCPTPCVPRFAASCPQRASPRCPNPCPPRCPQPCMPRCPNPCTPRCPPAANNSRCPILCSTVSMFAPPQRDSTPTFDFNEKPSCTCSTPVSKTSSVNSLAFRVNSPSRTDCPNTFEFSPPSLPKTCCSMIVCQDNCPSQDTSSRNKIKCPLEQPSMTSKSEGDKLNAVSSGSGNHSQSELCCKCASGFNLNKKASRIKCTLCEQDANALLNSMIDTIIDGFEKISCSLAEGCKSLSTPLCADPELTEASVIRQLTVKLLSSERKLNELRLNIHQILSDMSTILCRGAKIKIPEFEDIMQQMNNELSDGGNDGQDPSDECD